MLCNDCAGEQGLPWSEAAARPGQCRPDDAGIYYANVLALKEAHSPEQLCSRMPAEFAQLLSYSRRLGRSAVPDVAYMRRLFHERLAKEGCTHDLLFDWDLGLPPPRGLQQQQKAVIDNRTAVPAVVGDRWEGYRKEVNAKLVYDHQPRRPPHWEQKVIDAVPGDKETIGMGVGGGGCEEMANQLRTLKRSVSAGRNMCRVR